MAFQVINNPGLGLCHILKINNFGYLIYSEDNIQHFIITEKIENNSFYFNRYFNNIDNALRQFNELEIALDKENLI